MQNKASHVVIAEFEVRPERFAEFIALARRFSVECVESEPGCWQFDVVELAPGATHTLVQTISAAPL